MREPILEEAIGLIRDFGEVVGRALREHRAGSDLMKMEGLVRRCVDYLRKAEELPPFEAPTVAVLLEIPLDGSPAAYEPPEGFPHCNGGVPCTYPEWKGNDETGGWVQHPGLIVTWGRER